MKPMEHNSFRFWILVSIVAISGFSQGMLLPLIAIIFENSGISSSLNGIHATALYIGVLIASPFMEKPLQRFGFKPIILIGGLLVILSLSLFPIWQAFWFWFVLRLTVGIGDHMLHFGTQTWITSASPGHRLGRNIALYGLFFGLGFTVGPLMTRLIEFNQFLPFFVSAGISFVAWLGLFFLKNEFPETHKEISHSHSGSMKRFWQSMKLGWPAFLPTFAYGFLEASLHGNFPVYALRTGIDVNHVSYILPAFAGGSLISQLPLGILSDKIGRRKILLTVTLSGFATFMIASFAENSPLALFFCFLVAGMLVGSLFSLGISYMADLLPKHLLPAGNLMCGISFSIGSILGPFLGGLFIQLFAGGSFFYIISGMLSVVFVMMAMARKENKQVPMEV